MSNINFIDKITEAFEKLPGVGHKTAKRYSYYLIEQMTKEDAEDFAKQIIDIKNNIKHCNKCGMLTLYDECEICKNDSRDKSTIMVLKDTKDILSIDSNSNYHGLYHSLNGLINPLKGVSPDDINIDSLFERINENTKEIILATPYSQEGETTALYISNLLKKFDVTVSRLSFGIPAGGDIEYLDELTLSQSIAHRIKKE